MRSFPDWGRGGVGADTGIGVGRVFDTGVGWGENDYRGRGEEKTGILFWARGWGKDGKSYRVGH